MAAAVELHPDVVQEAAETRQWYADRSAAAASAFMAELDRAIGQVAENPQRWPAHSHGTRRYLMHRFPYAVVYRQTGPATVQVIAVAHGRRKPGYWRNRL